MRLNSSDLPPNIPRVSHQPVWKSHHVITLLVGVFTCMFTASLVGQLLNRFAWHYDQKSPQALFVMQIAGSFFGLQLGGLVCFHFFLKWHEVGWREGFGLRKPVRTALVAFLVCIAFLPVAWGLQAVIRGVLLKVSVHTELQSTVVAIQEKTTPGWQQALLAVLAVAVAPVVEELLFRGVLFRWVRDRGRPRQALWISSLLFGAIHFNLLAFVPLTLFGALLAWLYQRSGNLLLCIFTHGFFNLLNLLAIVFQEPLGRWLDSIS